MSLNLLTALCLALAGFAVGARQILLSPRWSTFPCAPFAVRAAMFVAAVALGAVAVKFWSADEAGTGAWAGAAAAPIAVIAAVMALYNVVLLVNVAAQRLPPGIWPRLGKIEAQARRPPHHPGRVPLELRRLF